MQDRLLLTGATGFIGNRLYDPLVRAGWHVRCLTRNVDTARARWPQREWIGGDVHQFESLLPALDGCKTACYFVHGMSDLRPGWVERELRAAEVFARAAAKAELERIVYLGGVAPSGSPSDHLRSRLETGAVLRSGSVPCLELRAAMIIGTGSASWTIVRDLAARLPVMVLPAWLSHRSEPVAIDDVVAALLRATELPLAQADLWDLPGPEALSGCEILTRVAAVLHRRPLMLRVPLMSPHLSSRWIQLVTRAEYHLAAELVEGLKSDLLARRPGFWSFVGLPPPMDIDHAARRALATEGRELSRRSRVVERLAGAVSRKSRAHRRGST